MPQEPTRIDDATVAKLIKDPNMRRKFPFLAAAHRRMTNPKKTRDCGGCPHKKKSNTAEYEEVRKAIGQMPVAKKAELKEVLGARQVVVKYLVRAGKKVTLKF